MTHTTTVTFKRLSSNSKIPEQATVESAGFDLFSNEDRAIMPGEWVLFGTGIAACLDEHHEGQIRPRSGMALKHGVTVLNAPGTIDADYRGEIKVLLINHSSTPYTVVRGDRIAQFVVCALPRVVVCEVDTFGEAEHTDRGTGGFGSTGR